MTARVVRRPDRRAPTGTAGFAYADEWGAFVSPGQPETLSLGAKTVSGSGLVSS